MKQDTHKTKVIFRKFGNDEVIALFPELAGTRDVSTCSSYMHIGQHASASVSIAHTTQKATEGEYAPLKQELESLGYNLTIAHKFTQSAQEKRREQVS